MSKIVDEMIKFRELLTPVPQQLNEAWDTEMHTAKKDIGKWDGYSLAELKSKKAALMKKEKRSAAEQKTVRQINFAIRAKQKKKWGKIKESFDRALALNETQKVKIIAYNSGYGQQLDVVAKDPKHHHEVEVVELRMGPNGAPQLIFKDTGGNSRADWNPKYGWVADYD